MHPLTVSAAFLAISSAFLLYGLSYDTRQLEARVSAQERLAIEFLDRLSADHHAIDAELYARLGRVFTAAQIVELGFSCAETMGVHRFLHTLDLFGTAAPAIPFTRDEVDATR